MIPIFTSHYSGKSVLTFDTPEDAKKYNNDSIIDICIENKIEKPFVVESKITGFMEMNKNFQKSDLKPRFGLTRFFITDLSEDNKANWHKITVFCKNTQGYKDLIRLHNYANLNHRGYILPEVLKKFWTENLKLVIPFYDSYIHRNIMYGTTCMPEFSGIPHNFFFERNELPFDDLIEARLPAQDKVLVKSIFYKNKEDFATWQTYRCALNLNVKGRKRTLDAPNFEHCHSKEFCFESFKEYANNI